MNVSIEADLIVLLYEDKKVLISLIFPTMDHYITHHPEKSPYTNFYMPSFALHTAQCIDGRKFLWTVLVLHNSSFFAKNEKWFGEKFFAKNGPRKINEKITGKNRQK